MRTSASSASGVVPGITSWRVTLAAVVVGAGLAAGDSATTRREATSAPRPPQSRTVRPWLRRRDISCIFYHFRRDTDRCDRPWADRGASACSRPAPAAPSPLAARGVGAAARLDRAPRRAALGAGAGCAAPRRLSRCTCMWNSFSQTLRPMLPIISPKIDEAFLLVLLLRILLAVAAQADALAQRLHRLEVLDPALVDLLQVEAAREEQQARQRELGLARLDDLLDLGPQRLRRAPRAPSSCSRRWRLEVEALLDAPRAAHRDPSPRRGRSAGSARRRSPAASPRRDRAAARAAGASTRRPRRPADRGSPVRSSRMPFGSG